MQITISPQLYGLLVVLIPLPFEIVTYFARKSDARRRQIFWFTLCFVSLNLMWHFSILDFRNELIITLFQYCVMIIAIAYIYHYWHIVSEIKKSQNQIHLLIINLIVIFSVLFINSLQNDKFYLGVLIHGQLIAFYFAGNLLIKIFKVKNSVDNLAFRAVSVSCVLACAAPSALFFLNDFIIKYLVINLGFFIVTIVYIRDYTNQMKIEFIERSNYISLQEKYKAQLKELELFKREQSRRLEENQRSLDELNEKQDLESKIDKVLAQYPELTERQIEVARLIVTGKSYILISEELHIAKDTVRKHAQDISLKMGLKGYKRLGDFILREAKKIE